MRAPRYKFSDEVRSTTRIMASRMVREGTIAETPEQLEAWIAHAPEVHASLQRGGYDQAFTSHDLFPLLQVFVGQAGGPAPPTAAPPPRPSNLVRVVAALLVLGLILLLLIIAT